MGQVCSCDNYSTDDAVVAARSEKETDIIHFFMLGIEGAGKTTIIRQLKCLCKQKPSSYQMFDDNWKLVNKDTIFDESELDELRNVIRINILVAFNHLIQKTIESGRKITKTEPADRIVQKWREICESGNDIYDFEIESEFGNPICELISDPEVSKTLESHNTIGGLQIDDGTFYFTRDVQRVKNIFNDSYSLTDGDIVNVRKPTVTFKSYKFQVKQIRVEIHDMGGQKTELVKIPRFMNQFLTANGHSFLLYVSSMAGFCEPDKDAADKTVLDKSLAIFRHVLNLDGVEECSVMIFLNKQDRFVDIIEERSSTPEGSSQLRQFLPNANLKPGNKHEDPYVHLKDVVSQRFKDVLKAKKSKKSYHIKYTQATDAKLMSTIFYAVENEIITSFLTRGSFL